MRSVLVLKLFFITFSLLIKSSFFSQEICNNGIDDDGNGLIDLNDPGCSLSCFGFGTTSTNVTSLIPNPSFETMNCCPSSYSQLNCASTWVQATTATSDYINSCGFMPSVVPQPLPDGSGIVGAIFSNGWQEYVGSCLLQPMLTGVQYDIQFDIAAGLATGQLANCGAINFGAIDITIFGNPSCANLPAATTGCPTAAGWINIGSVTYTPVNSWGTLTITIIPTVDINAIMIGSPCTLPAGYNGSCYAYFMFDNILLNTSSSFVGAAVTGIGSWQSDNTQLSASPDSIAGTYQWYLDGVALIGETDTILNLPSPCSNTFGTGNFTFVQSVDTGCLSLDYPITIPEFPTSHFTAKDSCFGANIVFNDSSYAGGNTIISWQWNFDDGTTSNSQVISHTFQSDGTYNVQLVVADSICSDTSIVPVVVYPIPSPVFTTTDVCFGIDVAFTDMSTINTPDNLVSWAWNFGDGNTSSLPNPSNAYASPGNYSINLTTVSNNGCTDSSQLSVNVFAIPVANFIPGSECLYSSVLFTDSSYITNGNIASYQWDFGNNSTSSTQNPSILYGAQNTYNVELTITSNNGCVDTIVKPYTPLVVPVALFTSTSQCVYDSLQFTDNSTFTSPASFLWSFGDGTPIVSAQTPAHLYSAYGTYDITLIITSANGCVNSAVASYDAYPIPVLAFSSTEICENTPPTLFTNTTTIPTGSMSSWLWGFGDGITSNLQSPSHVYLTEGTYSTTLIGISSQNCSDTIMQNTIVLAKPSVSFFGDSLTYCYPFCVNFSDQTIANSSNNVSWEWDFGDGSFSSVPNPRKCYENLSNTITEVFNVELIVTNDLGCSDTLLQVDYITSWPVPLAEFSIAPATTDMYHALEIEFTNNSIGGFTYDWDFENGTTSTQFEPITSYSDSGTFVTILVVTSPEGCLDTTSQLTRINIVVTLFAPNAFTPNGDGINDDFMFKSYGIVEDGLEFMVFNRWGELIYNTDIFKAWDGHYKGVLSQEGMYIYKINCKDVFGKKHIYTGHVNLLK